MKVETGGSAIKFNIDILTDLTNSYYLKFTIDTIAYY